MSPPPSPRRLMGIGDECQSTPPTLSPKKWISLNPSLAIRPSAYVLSHPAGRQRRRVIPMTNQRSIFGSRREHGARGTGQGARGTGDGIPFQVISGREGEQ